MSAKIMGAVYDLDLPANEQAVLLALADHADHEGNDVRPSNGLVAWKLGMSDDTVGRMKKKLVERGILVVVSEEIGQAKEYRIDLAKGTKKAPYQRRHNWHNPPQIAAPHPPQSAAPRNLRPSAELCGTPPPQSFAAPPSAELCGTNRKKEPSEEPSEICAAAPPAQKIPVEASPVQEATALWISHRNASSSHPYRNSTAKRRKADEAAMLALIKDGMTPEQIGETAKAMFAVAGKAVNGKRAWWSSNCQTIENFAVNINQIEKELESSGVRIGGQETQAEREDREQREFYGSSF